jgi:ABC-type uncharacterized transport system permease subunit
VQMAGHWQPLQDNLSALVTLALLLALFVAYVQARRPIPSLEWLIMPVVVLLLLLAGHFGATQPEAYLTTTYSMVHRIFTYVGMLAFVVAGAVGVLYLLSDKNLRARGKPGTHAPPSPLVFGSLERLERLTYSAVTLGFALFTVGLLSGIVWVIQEDTLLGDRWYLTPKVLLSLTGWALFAVVLHTPIAPRLRGRRNAMLSIAGLLLTLASLVAFLVMAAGGRS